MSASIMTTPSAATAIFFGLEPTSFSDWPGRIATVLFFSGCNLRCPTCHNRPWAWEPSPPVVSCEQALIFLKKRKPWLDGVVLCGGEPTLFPDLFDLCREIKALKLEIKLDSHGLCPDIIGRLIDDELVHTLAVDIKGPWQKYPSLTGHRISAETAKLRLGDIFHLATQHPERFHFRCTSVPDLNAQDLKDVRGQVPSEFSLTIQPYRAPRLNQ